MRLRNGVRVLRRGPDEVQIGTDPRWAVRLDRLTPAEVDQLLRAGEDGDLDVLTRPQAARAGVTAPRARAIVDMVGAAGLVVPARRDSAVWPACQADAVCWGLVRADGDGSAAVRARAARVVGIVGLDRVGVGIATALAASGVGTVLLDDDAPVTSVDVGPGGHRTSDIGRPRRESAARAVRDVAPEVGTGPGRRCDLVVLVERGLTDPARALALVAQGTAHLPVVLHEAGTSVGPLVVPGDGRACLRCVELHRTDDDAAWPMVAAQLAAPVRRRRTDPGVPAVVAAVTAALAAAEAVTHLDGEQARTRGASWEVDWPGATPRLRRWTPHPACGCTGLPPV